MKCVECGTEISTADACATCGAPVPAYLLAKIGDRASRHDTPASRPPVTVPVPGTRLRVAAAILALAGVVLILDGCGLPAVIANGFQSEVFNGFGNAAALQLAAAAILGVCASVLLLARLAAGWRWVSAALLLAVGIRAALMFADYQFGLVPAGDQKGAGPVVGMAGGLVLVAAGVVGVVAGWRRNAQPAAAPEPGPADSYVPGRGDAAPVGIRRVLRGYTALAWAAAIAGPALGADAILAAAGPDYGYNSNAWRGVAASLVLYSGAGLWVWAVVLFVQRHRFALRTRRPNDPIRSTVTAADARRRTLVLDAPEDQYLLPKVTIRLAWWTVTDLPRPGDTVTLYGKPTGLGPVLVTTSEPTRIFLATGKRKLAFTPDASKPSEAAAADATQA